MARFHVSSSLGSDAGDASEGDPLENIGEALSRYDSSSDDEIALLCGDVFSISGISWGGLGGTDAAHRRKIIAYGDFSLGVPLLDIVGGAVGINVNSGDATSWIHVKDINIQITAANRASAEECWGIGGNDNGGTGHLFENVGIRGFRFGANSDKAGHVEYRNCLFMDIFAANGTSGSDAIIGSYTDLNVNGCMFCNVGARTASSVWVANPATILWDGFGHAVYAGFNGVAGVGTPAVVNFSDNLFADIFGPTIAGRVNDSVWTQEYSVYSNCPSGFTISHDHTETSNDPTLAVPNELHLSYDWVERSHDMATAALAWQFANIDGGEAEYLVCLDMQGTGNVLELQSGNDRGSGVKNFTWRHVYSHNNQAHQIWMGSNPTAGPWQNLAIEDSWFDDNLNAPDDDGDCFGMPGAVTGNGSSGCEIILTNVHFSHVSDSAVFRDRAFEGGRAFSGSSEAFSERLQASNGGTPAVVSCTFVVGAGPLVIPSWARWENYRNTVLGFPSDRAMAEAWWNRTWNTKPAAWSMEAFWEWAKQPIWPDEEPTPTSAVYNPIAGLLR